MTDDFAGHLSLEHRSGPRDLISFLDEPTSSRYSGRRVQLHQSRVLGGSRPRRYVYQPMRIVHITIYCIENMFKLTHRFEGLIRGIIIKSF